ncbi:hypothetical protein CR513_11993, partial [Mucuna pruriens]
MHMEPWNNIRLDGDPWKSTNRRLGYNETFALVTKMVTMRTLLVMVSKLKKLLYGLRQYALDIIFKVYLLGEKLALSPTEQNHHFEIEKNGTTMKNPE